MMKALALTLVAAAVLASAAPAATSSSTACSDLAWLNQAIRGSKKSIVSLKLSKQGRYGAAVWPAKQALWLHRNSPQPCESNYWLQRRYEIKYSVALLRWTEEKRDGNQTAADRYWADLEFWGDEIRDVSLEG